MGSRDHVGKEKLVLGAEEQKEKSCKEQVEKEERPNLGQKRSCGKRKVSLGSGRAKRRKNYILDSRTASRKGGKVKFLGSGRTGRKRKVSLGKRKRKVKSWAAEEQKGKKK